jgi:hypothetical protein
LFCDASGQPQKRIIAVIGATGMQGGSVVRAINADKSGEFVARAVCRNVDSDKAKSLKAAGVEVVYGDVNDLGSLVRAFKVKYIAFFVIECSSNSRMNRAATAHSWSRPFGSICRRKLNWYRPRIWLSPASRPM